MFDSSHSLNKLQLKLVYMNYNNVIFNSVQNGFACAVQRWSISATVFMCYHWHFAWSASNLYRAAVFLMNVNCVYSWACMLNPLYNLIVSFKIMHVPEQRGTLPNRSSFSSLLASLLSRRSCLSISALIRFDSFASSLKQQAIMDSKVITAKCKSPIYIGTTQKKNTAKWKASQRRLKKIRIAWATLQGLSLAFPADASCHSNIWEVACKSCELPVCIHLQPNRERENLDHANNNPESTNIFISSCPGWLSLFSANKLPKLVTLTLQVS